MEIVTFFLGGGVGAFWGVVQYCPALSQPKKIVQPKSDADQLRPAPNRERRLNQGSTTLKTRAKSGRTSVLKGRHESPPRNCSHEASETSQIPPYQPPGSSNLETTFGVKTVSFPMVFAHFRIFDALETILTSRCSKMASRWLQDGSRSPFRGHLGAFRGHLGAHLGRSWAILGHLGPS